MNAKKRRSPYTKEEIQRIVKDRENHPDMTTLEWCKQYPISEQVFYYLKRKVEGKIVPSPLKAKRKAKAKAKATPKGFTTSAKLAHALDAIRHWRKEATLLAEQLITESLTE